MELLRLLPGFTLMCFFFILLFYILLFERKQCAQPTLREWGVYLLEDGVLVDDLEYTQGLPVCL